MCIRDRVRGDEPEGVLDVRIRGHEDVRGPAERARVRYVLRECEGPSLGSRHRPCRSGAGSQQTSTASSMALDDPGGNQLPPCLAVVGAPPQPVVEKVGMKR